MKKFMLSLILIFTFALCACSTTPPNNTPPTIYDHAHAAKYAVVEVVGKSTEGSGIIVYADSSKVHIITNHHVVEDFAQTKVRFYGEYGYHDAQILGKEPNYDICVLEVSYNGADITPLTLGYNVDMGQQLVALGYNGGQIGMYSGIVNTVDKFIFSSFASKNLCVLSTDVPFLGGCSGGALINSSGVAVGISSYAYRVISQGSTLETGITYAVPGIIAKAIYNRIIELRGSGSTNISLGTPFTILNDGTVMFGAGDSYMIFRHAGDHLEVLEGGDGPTAKYKQGDKLKYINASKIGSTLSEVLAQMYSKHVNTIFSK